MDGRPGVGLRGRELGFTLALVGPALGRLISFQDGAGSGKGNRKGNENGKRKVRSGRVVGGLLICGFGICFWFACGYFGLLGFALGYFALECSFWGFETLPCLALPSLVIAFTILPHLAASRTTRCAIGDWGIPPSPVFCLLSFVDQRSQGNVKKKKSGKWKARAVGGRAEPLPAAAAAVLRLLLVGGWVTALCSPDFLLPSFACSFACPSSQEQRGRQTVALSEKAG